MKLSLSSPFLVLFSLLVGMFQTTALTMLPAPWSVLKPVLAILPLLVLFAPPRQAYIFAVSSGFVMDLFALESPSFVTLRLLLLTASLLVLLRTLLTNRSIYTALALVGLIHALDWIVLTAAIHILPTFSSSFTPAWLETWQAFVANLLFVLIYFVMHVKLAARFFGAVRHSSSWYGSRS